MNIHKMWDKLQKVQTLWQHLTDCLVSIVCKAVYVCMLMDSCVYTLHSIPHTSLLLAVGSSDLCVEDG